MKKKQGVFDIVSLILLSVLCLSMLYPFINTLFISLSDMKDVLASNGMMLYPKSIRLDAYRYVLRYHGITTAYRNTIFITLAGTSIAMILMTLGAYVLTQKKLPGHHFMITYVLITMFFSGGLIPNYITMKNLKLLNTLWVLILPPAINTWYMLLERNFFQALPIELSESARIDGASEWDILIRLILPLSTPILATIALFHSVGRWNEYSSAIIYNSKTNLNTLQVIIHRMYSMNVESMDLDTLPPPTESVQAATIITATLPILCVYPFLQRYFTKGILVGSLKG